MQQLTETTSSDTTQARRRANLGRIDCRLLVVNMGAEGTANSVKL